jgi:tetratricopeptide (TPR) repeat protein
MKYFASTILFCVAFTTASLFGQDIATQYSTFFNEGVKKSGEQKFSEAIAFFNRALELKADYTEALFARGQCYLLTDERNKACEDFDKCYKLGLKQATEYIEKYCGKNAPGRTKKPSAIIQPKKE